METASGDRSSQEFVLSVERLIDAPIQNVWRCWTEAKLVEQWICPKPWFANNVCIDLRPGGEFSAAFNGPNGEKFDNIGGYLEIKPQRRLVSTDALRPGWIPSERAFMVAESLFDESADGKTKFVFRAMHWNEEAHKEHEKMGFHEGWATVADQLAAAARSL